MSSPMSLAQSTAGRLRAEMALRRLTSTELASVLDLSQSSASRRMTGQVGMDLDEVEKVAAWLGISPLCLLGEHTTSAATAAAA